VGVVRAGRGAWGTPRQDWIEDLAIAVDASSQNKAAKRLGLSAASISGALRRTYRSPLTNIEAAVRRVLMLDGVDCPELGQIDHATCQAWSKKALTFTGSSRLSGVMARACQSCPHNLRRGAPYVGDDTTDTP